MKSVIGRLKRGRVYCANTIELVALNLFKSGLIPHSRSLQRIHAREKYGSNGKGDWHKKPWAWISVFEKYNLRARASGKEASKFCIG